jgi:hypothetical protein
VKVLKKDLENSVLTGARSNGRVALNDENQIR